MAIADWRVPSNDPRNNCGVPVPFSFLKLLVVTKLHRSMGPKIHLSKHCHCVIRRITDQSLASDLKMAHIHP